MTNFYFPGILPAEYNQAFLEEELQKIAFAISAMEVPTVVLVPSAAEPTRPQEGMLAHADGVNWNPGHGKGVYQYSDATWVPLFATAVGLVTSTVTVTNTTTETSIYSGMLPANSLSLGDFSELILAGSYDTNSASDVWTVRIKFGGTTIHTLTRTSSNNVTAAGWHISMQGSVRTSGVSGTMADVVRVHDDDTVLTVSDAGTHTIDTTADIAVDITVQWNVATASTTFRLAHGIIIHHH